MKDVSNWLFLREVFSWPVDGFLDSCYLSILWLVIGCDFFKCNNSFLYQILHVTCMSLPLSLSPLASFWLRVD